MKTIKPGFPMPQYFPLPFFLLEMNLSQTARLIYGLILNRMSLSEKNHWVDENGEVYVFFPVEELAQQIHRSSTAVKHALNELTGAGLLRRRHKRGHPANFLYLNYPEAAAVENPVASVRWKTRRKTDPTPGGKPTGPQAETCPDSGWETDPTPGGKPTPKNLTRNTLQKHHTCLLENATAYGSYENVILTEKQLQRLREEYPQQLDSLIEQMSRYIAAYGKHYENYEAALRIWAETDNAKKEAREDTPQEGDWEW